MPNIKDLATSAITWPFLQEPIWRWFVFLIAMGGIMAAWNGVLRHMRSAE